MSRFYRLDWRRTGWRLLVALLITAAALALWKHASGGARAILPGTRLALIVPDGTADDDVSLMAWRDTAAEMGFPLEVVAASRLLRDRTAYRDAALIVPDLMHRQMNDALRGSLEERVAAGADLMLVYDAGVSDMNGRYRAQSPFAALAGVRYALYDELQTGMLREQSVSIDAAAIAALRLPPGKLIPADSEKPLTSAQSPTAGQRFGVVGYRYGRMRFTSFVTSGTYDGLALMYGDEGNLMAGLHRAGSGRVLFVNLPLTYLKLRTDGLFLSSFLRYFAQDVVGLPQLSPVPDGRGALVMNWHIDSQASVPAMERLTALGGFDDGPYSVHLTAGPDVDTPGDGRGMDLAHNDVMQQWVRRFVERGDEIGSHGGWIHNEFGRLVGTQAPVRSADLIERNSEVVAAVSGHPVREYSAPTGNHPAWVTPWLREHGVVAYYFTGDIGMAPTRSYQDGKRGPSGIWAFPVLSYGRDAAFEEARAHGVAETDIEAWLRDVADYCAENHTVRLVYFHPTGIVLFPVAFRHWLEHVRTLQTAGMLRFTTMADYAEFANDRLDVTWSIERTAGRSRLVAAHPKTLAHMSWLVRDNRFGPPAIVEGRATISHDRSFWRIVADDGSRLVVDLPDQTGTAAAPGGRPS